MTRPILSTHLNLSITNISTFSNPRLILCLLTSTSIFGHIPFTQTLCLNLTRLPGLKLITMHVNVLLTTAAMLARAFAAPKPGAGESLALSTRASTGCSLENPSNCRRASDIGVSIGCTGKNQNDCNTIEFALTERDSGQYVAQCVIKYGTDASGCPTFHQEAKDCNKPPYDEQNEPEPPLYTVQTNIIPAGLEIAALDTSTSTYYVFRITEPERTREKGPVVSSRPAFEIDMSYFSRDDSKSGKTG